MTTKLSLLIQCIANDAGIPLSKAEKILHDAAGNEIYGNEADSLLSLGRSDGERDALVILGANKTSVETAIKMIVDKEAA